MRSYDLANVRGAFVKRFLDALGYDVSEVTRVSTDEGLAVSYRGKGLLYLWGDIMHFSCHVHGEATGGAFMVDAVVMPDYPEMRVLVSWGKDGDIVGLPLNADDDVIRSLFGWASKGVLTEGLDPVGKQGAKESDALLPYDMPTWRMKFFQKFFGALGYQMDECESYPVKGKLGGELGTGVSYKGRRLVCLWKAEGLDKYFPESFLVNAVLGEYDGIMSMHLSFPGGNVSVVLPMDVGQFELYHRFRWVSKASLDSQSRNAGSKLVDDIKGQGECQSEGCDGCSGNAESGVRKHAFRLASLLPWDSVTVKRLEFECNSYGLHDNNGHDVYVTGGDAKKLFRQFNALGGGVVTVGVDIESALYKVYTEAGEKVFGLGVSDEVLGAAIAAEL